MKNKKYPCDKHVPKDRLIETIYECEDCDEFCIMHGCKIGRKPRLVFRSILSDLDKAPKNITRQTLIDYDPKNDPDKVLLESQIPQCEFVINKDYYRGYSDCYKMLCVMMGEITDLELSGCGDNRKVIDRYFDQITSNERDMYEILNSAEDPRKKD